METKARRSPNREIGGVLFGAREGDDVHVVEVVQVQDPAATRRRFVLHRELREATIARYLAELPCGSPVGYVGTWHSHPADKGPSFVDRRTFRRQVREAPDTIAMLIVASADGEWNLYAAVGGPEAPIRRAEVALV